MTDLTKLTAPLGELDNVYGPGTRAALMAWPHGWEVYIPDGWAAKATISGWYNHITYRAKPAPLIKPSVDWSLCPEWANWLAVDKNDQSYIYTTCPNADDGQWVGGARFIRIDEFPFYTPGTCDWTDSLVQKPEGDQ